MQFAGVATVIATHLAREPTASPVLTNWWILELMLATNFGSPLQMVTKVGSQILATKFGFVPDCLVHLCFFNSVITKNNTVNTHFENIKCGMVPASIV